MDYFIHKTCHFVKSSSDELTGTAHRTMPNLNSMTEVKLKSSGAAQIDPSKPGQQIESRMVIED